MTEFCQRRLAGLARAGNGNKRKSLEHSMDGIFYIASYHGGDTA